MSKGPLDAKLLLSGDVISITTGYSNYATNQVYNAATVNAGSSICGAEVDWCMACGNCKPSLASASAIGYPVTSVPTNNTLMTYTINSMSFNNNNYHTNPVGTPIHFGDLISIYVSVTNGGAKLWTTGPNVTGIGFNDVINLASSGDEKFVSSTVYSTTDNYKVWTIVNPVNNEGLYTSPGSTNYVYSSINGVYYGNPIWIQSIGKSVQNKNYQFATLNNLGYDCLLSTQDVSTIPSTSNYGPMFIFTDPNGQIPTYSGEKNVPKAGKPVSNGLFGLGIFTKIGNIVDIVLYLVLFVILTIVFVFLIYLLL